YTDQTLDLFFEARNAYPKEVGIVIQAYLHRTGEDIQKLISADADVRLCKGAYKEDPDTAIQHMADIRKAFKQHAASLLSSPACLRIATHDDEIIQWMIRYAEEQSIPKERFEFQMLYGLRKETCEKLAQNGYQVRVYVPYGTMWFPYFTRRLRERKENLWFLLSTMFQK
ncbi:proline dehydrogenase family protein, partial [Balneolaceae bacterium ANBcel3]|nr:proline dehydrogenase family protein [Balneolaceae bacterium ANBcel3]